MNTKLTIRPYARLLTMLGDQLIKNEQIAVLELIKNAYDADADWVKLSFVGFSPNGAVLKDSKIVIEDNGIGMSKDIIQNAWMSPATANKSSKDGEVKLTKEKKRIIQGEKGIGRYAMLKLGSIINMITRPEECADEYSVRLDFSSFDENYSSIGPDPRNLYLDELSFDLQVSSPKEFVDRSVSIGRKIFEGSKNAHGTRLEISGLKGRWNQAKIDAVKASFVQFSDFFDEVITKEKQPDFFIGVSVNGENIDKKDASDNIVIENLMETQSVFQIKSGHYDSKEKTLSFEINGSSKKLSCASDVFRGLRVFKDNFFDKENKIYRDISDFGDFDFNFYIFDFNAKTPSRYALVEGAKEILKKHRVYLLRDNVRVMPYGDPSDDWLQIDIGRGTISAGAFFSNDQLVGQIRITKKGNPHLKDKTNREGLIEEESYTDDFICIIRSFLSYLRITDYKRYLDENKRKNEIEKTNTRQVNNELANLKNYFKDDKKASSLLSQLEKVYKVERKYLECRANRTESLAAVGLSVETASHDMMLMMGKGLSQLQGLMNDSMVGTIDSGSLTSELQKLFGIFSFVKEQMKDMQLLFTSSKQKRRQLRVEDYLKKVQTIYKRTLQRCSITCETEIIGSPLLAKCTDADILQLLINLMDNAVYWLVAGGKEDRRIKIVLDGDRCQMIFSDNGPGIRQEDVPYIFEAFYSGKGEEGRGLGLYISRKLMERNEYSIDLADLDSEKVLKGANFVVSFIKQKD